MKHIDFAIVGAQKCATTSMAAQLARHPGVCFCQKKEPHFFSRNTDWRKHLPSYHELYAPLGDQVCGEASTTYSMFPEYPHVAENLFSYNKHLKLTYIVRDPVARIVSHYMHRRITGRARGPIDRVVLENPSYVNRSRYGVQIRRYLEHFPRSSILVVVMEEYLGMNNNIFREIETFLGLDQVDRVPDLTAENVSLDRRTLRGFPGRIRVKRVIGRLPQPIQGLVPGVLYRQVVKKPLLGWSLLQDDVEFIESLLGRRLEQWRSAYE